jgi:hypothetical protein
MYKNMHSVQFHIVMARIIKFYINKCETERNFLILSVRQGSVKEDEMGRGCSTNGETRNAYRILVGKPEGKRDHYEDQDVGGWTRLEWILER